MRIWATSKMDNTLIHSISPLKGSPKTVVRDMKGKLK
jgi:hypothetical protein